MTDEERGVCIVTQPHRSHASKDHAHDLADIIAEITTVSVLTANLPEDSTLPEDHEVVEYSSRGAGGHIVTEVFRFLLNQLSLCQAIYRREEDVMLFFGTTSYVLPIVVSRLLGKTAVVLPRGDVALSLKLRWAESLPDVLARGLAGIVRGLEHFSYTAADAVVTYTPSMAEQLRLDRYEEKLYTDGARFVDTEKFDIRVPYEEREKAVGFIGRLDVEKRVPALVAAAKHLSDDIRFVFVGDGDYREMLERELAEEIERGQVEVVGWVDREEVPEQLNRMRLLLVPSHRTEGLPTAILEGMACGTPSYATPVSGVPDVVREGETGFLLENVDGEAIAVEIERIFDREDLGEMSQNARELLEEGYSFESAVERWEYILAETSSTHRAGA